MEIYYFKKNTPVKEVALKLVPLSHIEYVSKDKNHFKIDWIKSLCITPAKLYAIGYKDCSHNDYYSLQYQVLLNIHSSDELDLPFNYLTEDAKKASNEQQRKEYQNLAELIDKHHI